MATIKGKWILNKVLPIPDKAITNSTTNFTSYYSSSSGEKTFFIGFMVVTNGNILYYCNNFGETTSGMTSYLVYKPSENGWLNEKSRIIDFGPIEQTIPDDLSSWITTNGKQLLNPSSDYLQELINQKKELATNLTTKGVQATEDEKFNTLVPKVLDISGGLEGFEEVTGLAGEDLAKNDVVAYFNGEPGVEILPDRSYYDNGNKYYVASGFFYSNIDGSLIEQRSLPTGAIVIRNVNSPTMNYCYTNDSTNKLITLYEWNGSEYVEVSNFNYSNTSIHAYESKDCVAFANYTQTETNIIVYVVNKNNYELNNSMSSSYTVYYDSYIKINVDYNSNMMFIAYREATQKAINVEQYSLEYFNKTSLFRKSGTDKYEFQYNSMIIFDGTTKKAVYYSRKTSTKSFGYVLFTNEYGDTYTLEESASGSLNYYYFVSASKDFNEIIICGGTTISTGTTKYLINVKDQTKTFITNDLLPIREALFSYKPNDIMYCYDNTNTVYKYEKLLGWGEQYKKLTNGGTSHYEHIGIVKEDCTEGENATVYKVSNKNLLIYNQEKTITPTKSTQTVTPDNDYDGLSKVTVNAIPSSYIVPSGTKEITENGSYDVTNYKTTNVNVPIPDGYIKPEGELDITENGSYDVTNYKNVEVNVSGSGEDRLQLLVNGKTSLKYFFITYTGDNVDFITDLDTSNVTYMGEMFYGCKNLTTIPLLNTSNVTYMSSMFYECTNLTSIPQLDTSKVTTMSHMFRTCKNLTSIPALNTSNVTTMSYMFDGCTNLKSILMYGMKVSFDISASTKFEREDLVTILNNLATVTTTQTLTMGTTNLAKLTDEDKAIATNKGWTLA